MYLRRWEPFAQLREMQRDLDQLFRGNHATAGADQDDHQTAGRWMIPLDVADLDHDFVVHASVPGMSPEDIDLTVDNNVLTIKGQTNEERNHKEGEYVVRERRSGSFQRSVRLPETLDVDNASPRYSNGVLTITFPKVEARQVKKLSVAPEGPAVPAA